MQNQAPPSPPSTVSPLTSEQAVTQPITAKGLNIGFDLIALSLVAATVFAGAFSSSAYFSSPDRTIFFAMTLLGLGIGLLRSKWYSDQPKSRLWLLWIGYAVSAAFLLMGILNSSPVLVSMALSVVAVVWCSGRLRGEPLSRCLFFGAAILFPFILESYAKRGYFESLDSLTLSITSLMADAINQPHARTDGLIMFKLGTADHFASIGVWDSAVALLGVSLFCTFAFKRGLVAAIMCVFLTLATWVACRSIAWLVLSSLSTRTGTWNDWSVIIESMVFAIGAICVVGLDQFLGECLKPIPFERVDPDYPLLAYIWNWICSLPQVILRIPKDNRIALRWRTRVKLAGKKSSLKTDYDWFRLEFLDMIFKPIGFLGISVDTARSWRISRNWKLLFASIPIMVSLIVVYGYIGVSLFKRKDIQPPFYAAESLNLCSTKSLEIACHKKQEAEFALATGLPLLKLPGDSEAEASVRTLRYVELLCKRILDIEPNNQLAKYRLGLILSIRNQQVDAETVMREIADGRRGDFPQASAWLSKSLTIQKGEGKEIAKQDLIDQLEAACKGKEVDVRLLFLYGQLLLEQGEKTKAIEVTKQAVALKPDFVLELARLYAKIGDDAGKIAAANQAEDYFAAKINFASEKETDRLAVAEARVLANRLDKACEVLSEGMRQKLGGQATIRQLSEIQGMIYRKSIRKRDDGKYDLDISLLEAMAETDPDNPTVSSEITNLLTYNAKPTKRLLEVFKNQMASGVTSFSSLLQLGESYYKIRNLNEAERFWSLAVAKEPDNPVALNKLATCLVELSSDNAEKALKLVVHANEQSPENADVLDTWGLVLMAANRPREALNKLELALRTNQERIETRRKLRSVYESLGMKEMAEMQEKQIKRLEESVAKNNDNQERKPNE